MILKTNVNKKIKINQSKFKELSEVFPGNVKATKQSVCILVTKEALLTKRMYGK